MRRRISAALAAIALGLVLLPAGATPATADAFNQCDSDTGCLPDNKTHTYCFSTFFSIYDNMREAAHYAMGNLADQTSYTRNFEDECSNLTDIIWIRDPDMSYLGLYDCRYFNDADECEQAYVYLNPEKLEDDPHRKSTACHEVGHSVGLTHHWDQSDDDCMLSGPVTFKKYNAHHREHINSRS